MSGDEPQNQDGANFCSNCGAPRKSSSSNFCSNCGNSFVSSSLPGNLQKDSFSQVPLQPVPQETFIPQQGYETTQNYGYQYPPDFITPNQIAQVEEPIFVNNEIKIVLLMGLTGYFSHILRYLLIYNRFPTVLDLILPLPIYLLIAVILAGVDIKFFQQKGLDISLNADTFDYTISLVLSSFFISSLNFQVNINQESSTIPESVYVAENSKMGMNYVQLPRATYIGQLVRPRTLFKSTMVIVLLAGIGLYLYFNSSTENITILTRLITAYLGGLALTNVSPKFGRYNEEMSKVGRFRTLLLFLIALFITFAALVGEGFFIALS
ncbi:MAG: hypothetical protein HeimC2_34030 [Candidatus Heimdallarchaeota archaeon LC_2]|nr:MAG: hypothetical protein HeimC2_34030 [Candidatus Heimdallarchaeota archaeon LC_2]